VEPDRPQVEEEAGRSVLSECGDFSRILTFTSVRTFTQPDRGDIHFTFSFGVGVFTVMLESLNARDVVLAAPAVS